MYLSNLSRIEAAIYVFLWGYYRYANEQSKPIIRRILAI